MEIKSADAASFSRSYGEVLINNFSHAPQSVSTLANTNTFTFSSSGSVTAIAEADAIAIEEPTFAGNYSSSEASGEGSEYLGVARSAAAVIARNFSVGAGETFSFNFYSFLGLATSIDTSPKEAANAWGKIEFFLFDDRRPETPFEFLNISGGLKTAGDEDFLTVDASDSFNLAQTLNTSFGGFEEYAVAGVSGNFSYTFDDAVNLTLVEVKTNQVTVKAPEPSSLMALLILSSFGGAIALKNKSR
ncbi:MAG: PEP-CTERM sorting domain-containing protein [Limnospira sp.]